MLDEFVPGDRAIWQSETAKTYQCPICLRPVFSQYEGNDQPTTIICEGFTNGGGHRLQWERKR
jgi:hypothetical protein